MTFYAFSNLIFRITGRKNAFQDYYGKDEIY